MPELPEVEVTRIGLKPLLKKDIEKVVIRNYSLRWPINSGLPELLKNQTLLDLSRRGKYILAKFNSGTLIIHLGMSGRLCIVSADEVLNKHDHVDIQFKQNNLILRYRDPRRFGSILWTEKDPYNHKLIKNLGPEPLNEEFDAKYLFSRLRNKQQCIKNAIMDSHMVVGVGNIYASEALYAAGIRPHRISKNVSMKEVSGLVKSGKISVGSTYYMGPFYGRYARVLVKSIHNNFRENIDNLYRGNNGCVNFKIIDRDFPIKRSSIRKGIKFLDNPILVKQFRAKVKLLHHHTTIREGYQPVLHCDNISQSAVIEKMDREILRLHETAYITFKFRYHPEYIEVGSSLLFREGKTKGVGEVIEILD